MTSASQKMSGTPANVRALCVGSDFVAVASENEILLFDRESGDVLRRIDVGLHVSALAFGGDGRLFAGGTNVVVVDLDAATTTPFHETVEHSWIEALGFSARGLLVRYRDRLRLLDSGGAVVVAVEPQPTRHGWQAAIDDAAVSPTGEVLFSRDDQLLVVAADVETPLEAGKVRAIGFSNEGSVLAVSDGSTGALYRWPFDASPIFTEYGFTHVRPVEDGFLAWNGDSACRFRDDGQTVWATRYHDGIRNAAVGAGEFFTVSNRDWIARRSIATGQLVSVFPCTVGCRVEALAFSADGTRLVAADSDARVVIWDTTGSLPERRAVADPTTLAPQESVVEHQEFSIVRDVAFAGHVAIAADALVRWDPDSGAIEKEELEVDAFSGGGRVGIAKGRWGEPLEVWDLQRRELVATMDVGDARHIRLSTDGRRLLVCEEANRDTTLTLWDVDEQTVIGELHVDRDVRADFDGSDVIVWWTDYDEDADEERAVMVRWDTRGERVVRYLARVELPWLVDAAFGAGHAVVWSHDEVCVVDCGTESVTARLAVEDTVTAAAIYGDGRRIALGIGQGAIGIWEAGGGDIRWCCSTNDGGWWAASANAVNYVLGPQSKR